MTCVLPPDSYDDRDEFASALGHLCLSYVALELMLVRLMADVKGDGDLGAADRLLGRRGFSERVDIILNHAVNAALSEQQIDSLDLLLSQANNHAHARHHYIHDRYTVCFEDAGIPAPEASAIMDPDGVWRLVVDIDSLVLALACWSEALHHRTYPSFSGKGVT